MIRLMDRNRTAEITMQELLCRNGNQYTPDFSADFFEVPYDVESDTYIVADVDYCIDMAIDWKHARGDFMQDEEVNPDDRLVMVDGISVG